MQRSNNAIPPRKKRTIVVSLKKHIAIENLPRATLAAAQVDEHDILTALDLSPHSQEVESPPLSPKSDVETSVAFSDTQEPLSRQVSPPIATTPSIAAPTPEDTINSLRRTVQLSQNVTNSSGSKDVGRTKKRSATRSRSYEKQQRRHTKPMASRSASSSSDNMSSDESSSSDSCSSSQRRKRRRQKHPQNFEHVFTAFVNEVCKKAKSPRNANSLEQHMHSSVCPRPRTVRHAIVEKPYHLQCVLIVSQGLDKSVCPILLQQGYLLFDYMDIYDRAITQITRKTNEVDVLRPWVESLFSHDVLLVRFYHWARTQSNHARLAICGVTKATEASVKQLCALGAIQLQNQRSFRNLPCTFRWQQPISGCLWRSSLAQYAQLDKTIMPRVGWSTSDVGYNVVVVLVGPTHYVQTLIDCGCYVYNEMWAYEVASQTLLSLSSNDGDTADHPDAHRVFAETLRNKTLQTLHSGFMVQRFVDWWIATLARHSKIQVVLCGLSAISDAKEIRQLQKMGALLFTSQAQTNLQCDYVCNDEGDLRTHYRNLVFGKTAAPTEFVVP